MTLWHLHTTLRRRLDVGAIIWLLRTRKICHREYATLLFTCERLIWFVSISPMACNWGYLELTAPVSLVWFVKKMRIMFEPSDDEPDGICVCASSGSYDKHRTYHNRCVDIEVLEPNANDNSLIFLSNSACILHVDFDWMRHFRCMHDPDCAFTNHSIMIDKRSVESEAIKIIIWEWRQPADYIRNGRRNDWNSHDISVEHTTLSLCGRNKTFVKFAIS